MRYRADIDGLRAFAVLPVVFFHAGSEIFSGGFVGVDIFFVISGYLITSIIVQEVGEGRFSILNFYERRIRRIFPALFTVIFFSGVAAYFILMPDSFQEFSDSVVATSLFASNILFWLDTGYFAATAESKPLLHTWSLAVEEQFYIFFPLLLVFSYRHFKERWGLILIPLGGISFLGSLLLINHDQSATFYLAPTRAWELFLGAFLASGLVPKLPKQLLRDAASLLGIIFIVWSITSFSEHTIFPGKKVLIPCLGAALLIYAGEGGSSFVGRFLSLPPMVFMGIISYSLYLWHWPAIVLAKQYAIDTLTEMEIATIIALSTGLAILSWRFVERPFRGGEKILSREAIFFGAAAVIFLASGFGAYGHLSKGWPSRIPGSVYELVEYRNSMNPRHKECLAHEKQWIAPENGCVYGTDHRPAYAVWGDSHAGAMINEIAKIANKYDESVKFISYSGCPTVMGIKRAGKPDHKCPEHNRQSLNYLEANPDIKTVFLISRHSMYINGWTADFGPAESGVKKSALITDSDNTAVTLLQRQSVYKKGLQETVNRLLLANKKIVLIYPVPETGYDIPKTLGKLTLRGEDPAGFTRPVAYFHKRNAFIFKLFDSFGQNANIVRIFPHQQLCDTKECIVFADNKPLYMDDDHLSQPGVEFIASQIEPIFKQ